MSDPELLELPINVSSTPIFVLHNRGSARTGVKLWIFKEVSEGKWNKVDFHEFGQQPHAIEQWIATQLQPGFYAAILRPILVETAFGGNWSMTLMADGAVVYTDSGVIKKDQEIKDIQFHLIVA